MSTDLRNDDYNRLMDAARERAHALRREAMNQFWHDAGLATDHAVRSAQRLAARLLRHAKPAPLPAGGQACPR